MEACRDGGSPWRVGWESIRANWLPMVVLWLLAAALVAGYTYVPCVKAALQPVFDFQTGGGWKAAVLNRIVFCGLLPGAFLLTIRSIRPPRPLLTVLANCVWMGAWGVASNAFFTLQTQKFGSGHDIATLAVKVLVDKCVWSLARCRAEWPRSYLRQIYLPILLADFSVWIPVQFAVYVFPLPLQIQIVGFAGAFWSLVGLASGKRLA